MATLRFNSPYGSSTAVPSDTPSRSVSSALQQAALPSLITAFLLSAGYAVLAALGEQPAAPPGSLWAIILVCVALFYWTHKKRFVVPLLTERATTFLRALSILAVAIELAYFGVPLIGSIPYNEFGWPVVHHVAVMQWLLILFGKRRKRMDLGISLFISAILFNRQMALFSILAYLMTVPMNKKRILVAGIVAATFVMLLGALRNQVLDVDTSGIEDVVSLPMSGSLFFIYLYLTGPIHSGLGLSSTLWDTQLGIYWNTVPEWALFSSRLNVSPELSFALFYGTCALLAQRLRNARTWELRCLGTLIHVYTFFSFFSNVLLSTPIIAGFLLVITARRLYPTRKPS